MAKRSGRIRSWAIVSLAVYAVAAFGVLLAPVSYGNIIDSIWEMLRGSVGITFGAGWIEFAANIALFVPLGFLLTILLRNPWFGIMLGIAVSIGVEIAQFMIPDRQPTMRDIVSNAFGAGAGALLGWLIVVRRERNAGKVTR
ncbi:VanZ family protein [Salinibacterium sp. PAMC 21357]|uniref:VanZ family protein n=1 Tax=Salinibacterium sp. PAMC 21357 TaxID=1112215 RepID=UPI000288A0A9|nr:VanZ family protein [Salinibacterium sp. PAMC 21357]